MSEKQAKKHISFYIGNKSIFLDKEEKRLMGERGSMFDFISLFDGDDDRYFAISVFEEKMPLVIKRADPDSFEFFNFFIYDTSKPLYNLFVRDDPNFFISSMEPIDRLKEFCEYFGFEYDIKPSGCEM